MVSLPSPPFTVELLPLLKMSSLPSPPVTVEPPALTWIESSPAPAFIESEPPGSIVKEFATEEKSASGSVEVVEADNGIFVIFHDFFLQMS